MSAALDAFRPHDDDDHHHNKDESHTPADRFQPIYVHDCENTPDRIVANRVRPAWRLLRWAESWSRVKRDYWFRRWI
ncbi:MAG: hypothetical protein QOH27_4534 [Mycobacterium sp.]|nr:hypothetical protein [Mycobacterium sp.]